MVEEPRIIQSGTFYYFLTDKLEKQAQQVIGLNGDKLEPFEVYLADASKRRYIAKFNLLITVKNGVVSIHTQQMGVKEAGDESFSLNKPQ